MDNDLISMSFEELKAEVQKLRAGIRQHRDNSGHDLCWYVPELWNLLPEKTEINPQVPPAGEFLKKCCLYRLSFNSRIKK